jgi:hypothetical protein
MIFAKSQPRITCKIKQANNEKFDHTLCDPWIEPLLRHKLVSLENFKSKQGFFLCLFREKKIEGKFVLSPTIEIMGYSSLKKYTTRKNAKAIEEWGKNSKRKKCKGRRSILE